MALVRCLFSSLPTSWIVPLCCQCLGCYNFVIQNMPGSAMFFCSKNLDNLAYKSFKFSKMVKKENRHLPTMFQSYRYIGPHQSVFKINEVSFFLSQPNYTNSRHNVYLTPYCDMLHIIFFLSIFIYKISLKCHLWNNSSL